MEHRIRTIRQECNSRLLTERHLTERQVIHQECHSKDIQIMLNPFHQHNLILLQVHLTLLLTVNPLPINLHIRSNHNTIHLSHHLHPNINNSHLHRSTNNTLHLHLNINNTLRLHPSTNSSRLLRATLDHHIKDCIKISFSKLHDLNLDNPCSIEQKQVCRDVDSDNARSSTCGYLIHYKDHFFTLTYQRIFSRTSARCNFRITICIFSLLTLIIIHFTITKLFHLF
mmetsp:Transcript_7298/g.13168  ORF Transcript_7298/g.13168 Transcript_7298/m.13168 type:complete len:227 (-) Transcript_7298:308-988(-)